LKLWLNEFLGSGLLSEPVHPLEIVTLVTTRHETRRTVKAFKERKRLIILAGEARLELATPGFGDQG